MKIAHVGFLISLASTSLAAADGGYEDRRDAAELAYSEHSYGEANRIYSNTLAQLELKPAQKRWVEFRVADTAWREAAASDQSDPTRLDLPRKELEKLAAVELRDEERDQTWAEIQESLGDWNWDRPDGRNWAGWPYYERALDWWAGAKDVETARTRYLAIVRKAARPQWAETYYTYGSHGNRLPMEVLENALRISQSDEDKAYFHYLLAVSSTRWAEWSPDPGRVGNEFEAAIRVGRSEWRDDALFQYALWMQQQGAMITNEDGTLARSPDYVRALSLYEQLLREFESNESRYHDAAKQQADEIRKPAVGIYVGSFFLPDSEIEFNLSWRNVKKVEVSIYPVDLARDVQPEKEDDDWLKSVSTAGRKKAAFIEKLTNDTGEHRPGRETITLDQNLPPGAYVAEARAGKESARELILVTDAGLIVKTAGNKTLAWFCDAVNSAPIAGAAVTLWTRTYDGGHYHWIRHVATTATNGVAVIELPRKEGGSSYFVAASSPGRQAYAQSYWYGYTPSDSREWRSYMFTDRTAYRPGDTVNWKIFARSRAPGSPYETPANEPVVWEVKDPRGVKVFSGKAELNSFGSAWGQLALTDKMPLGEYTISFMDEHRNRALGDATLFRLEEYKLPEFKVRVQTPEENGRKKTYLLGETVEAEIQADYYFGGPVANADVEVVVQQQTYYHWWHEPWPFGWYYKTFRPAPGWRGGGEVIKRETLKTDALGRARIRFETPPGAGQDFEYDVEARVVDASRREITGQGSVKVGRQRYYAHVTPDHCLYGPGDHIDFNIKTIDANDQPVAVTGTVKITRQQWIEVWLRPDGREITGADLAAARRKAAIWPPPPAATNERPWVQVSAQYESEDVLVRAVGTDTNGAGALSFSPEKEGYYVATWNSPQAGGVPVNGTGSAWVTTDRSRDIGYYHAGGLEIIVDKDTARVGHPLSVMLASPASDRWALFSAEADGDILNWRIVHLDGTVKLIPLPIEEGYTPNIFLAACGFSDGQFAADTKEVIVPPTKNFLDVEIASDREQFEPRDEAVLRIKATDHDGNPARVELGLALADESVLYIQEDLAGDPREFFYGNKRSQQTQVQSTFHQKSLVRQSAEGERNPPGKMRPSRNRVARAGLKAGYAMREMALSEDASDAASFGAMAPDALAMPAAPQELMFKKSDLSGELAKSMSAGGEASSLEQEPAVVVRSDFRATAFWQPDVVTDKKGEAMVKVKLPDSLTTWRATARAASAGPQFGMGEHSILTRQPLIVRLQSPRFFVVGDTCTVSAVINNNTEEPLTVSPDLTVSGLVVVAGVDGDIAVPPQGEARADWTVSAATEGPVLLRVTGKGKPYSDAMEKSFAVCAHGIEKFVNVSTRMDADQATLLVDLPSARRADTTRLAVQVAPSIATTMLDALPYLADYPYGCTEQTMSRFLPAAVVARTLKSMGLHDEDIAGRIFGGVDEAARLQRTNQLAKLDRMIDAGLDRLYDFQHADGGWGWWKEGGSDHWMSAYVAWGLAVAKEAGIDVRGNVVRSAVKYLNDELVKEDLNPDLQCWMLHALSAHNISSKATERAMERLFTDRDRLNAYSRSLLLLSVIQYGDPNKIAPVLARNLRDGVIRDDHPDQSVLLPQTAGSGAAPASAHWGAEQGWWRWSEGAVESTAFALKALVAANPKDSLVAESMNWLVKNRRGTQWNNTRDTAICILALADYLKASGETAPDLEYEIAVNGTSIATQKLTAANALSAPTRIAVDVGLLRNGTNEIRIIRRGTGTLYASAQAAYFSLEEPVTPAGSEIFVNRQYYKLESRQTLLKGVVYDKRPLNDGDSIASGDRVEVRVAVETKNDYEYLMFEDLKPGGFEAVDVRSGESLYARELTGPAGQRRFSAGLHDEDESDYTGRTQWIYQELRDRNVALFADRLPQGIWEIRYTLRAETPGQFHALPVMGQAMYVPEIRCNGAEVRVTVTERKTAEE